MSIFGAKPNHFRTNTFLLQFALFIVVMAVGLSVIHKNLTTTVQAAAQAELPRVFLDTTYVPPTGQTITVNAGGNLQAAINLAVPGDVILVQAGATFTGNYTLPNKSGSGWIVIRSSASDGSLPAPGTRVTPANAAQMPKLISPNSNPAIRTGSLAHHYRLIGIEIGHTGADTYGLVQLGSESETSVGQLPNNLILDRCYIHGNDTGQIKTGVRLNSASTAIIDSYVSNIHAVSWESQAIAGYTGSGPYKIVNNFIEASAVNLMFGGAVPSISNLVPSDIEIRRNHFSKRLSWKQDDPSYAGTAWMCKNLFELKIAQRVLIDGNLFENSWPTGQSADGAPQKGWVILFTVRSEDGAAPWAVIQDVNFTNNIVRRSNAGFQIQGGEGQGMRRFNIANNLIDDIGPRWGNNDKTGRAMQVNDTTDLVLNHNTVIQSAAILVVFNTAVGGFTFTNNIAPHNSEGVIGDNAQPGTSTLNMYFPGYVFQKNVIAGGASSAYPANNFFPTSLSSVGFVNSAGGNYRLASTSPYKNAGTDGMDLGADLDAIEAAMAGSGGGGGGGGGNVPPTVSITGPAEGATFAAPANIAVSADAADSDGAISKVEFYAGATLIGTDLDSPYTAAWNNVPAGAYTLTAKATDDAGVTVTSAPITVTVNGAPTPTKPAAPTNLAGTSPARGRIDLTWADNSNNETGFRIQRSTNGTDFTLAATVGPNVTAYSNTGLTPGKNYWYRVRAYNGAGNSTFSNTVKVWARQ